MLRHYSQREKEEKPLKEYVILLIQHLLRDSLDFLEALEIIGAEKTRTIIVGIPYSSKNDIVNKLKNRGYKVYAPKIYPSMSTSKKL